MFINRYGEVRGGWVLAASIAMFFVLQICIQLMFGLVLGFIAAITGADVMAMLFSWGTVIMIIIEIVIILGIVLLFRLFYRRPLRQMGLESARWLPRLAQGLLFGVVSIAAAWGILLATGTASVAGVEISVALSPAFLLSLLLFLAVGFCEEMLSRGLHMTALKTTRRRWIIFTLHSLLFALLHILNANVTLLGLFNIFLVGLLFGYMFIRTGSIWMPIGYHITWNFFQGNILGMSVSGNETVSIITTHFSGPDWITGGAFGAEGGVAVTAIILLGFAVVRFCVRKPENPGWTMDSDMPLVRMPKY